MRKKILALGVMTVLVAGGLAVAAPAAGKVSDNWTFTGSGQSEQEALDDAWLDRGADPGWRRKNCQELSRTVNSLGRYFYLVVIKADCSPNRRR